MNWLRTTTFITVLVVLVTLPALAQVDYFARKHLIPYPAQNIGWGNAIAGVDFDGDGNIEIYAVNNNMYDTGSGELIPVIYKYEFNGTTWSIVWGDTLDIPAQNTWPALTYGDWDKDGKTEVIWGPVNNFTGGNTNPDRIIVYEEKGDGSDVMGVDDGTQGDYRPNARWDIESAASYNLRPFRWVLHDIDSDGTDELIFCDRASSTGGVGYKFGVVSVDNIPDNGDGSETWTLEASGKDLPTASSTAYDMAVLDSSAYFFHATTSGYVSRIRWRDGQYIVDSAAVALAPLSATGLSGGFKTVQVVDFDGDGNKELIGAGYSSATNNRIWILEVTAGGDSLVATELYDTDLLVGSGTRLLGSDQGDLDNDGNLDVVFGGRNTDPFGAIVRVEYKGSGSVTDGANYDFSIIESEYGTGNERYDFVQIFNLDADPELEVLYGHGYGGEYDIPMIILDHVQLASEPIAISVARADTNKDYVPDLNGQAVTVMGYVTSINPTKSSNRFQYFISDATGGICVTKGSETGGGPVYALGERLWVTGTIGQFAGLTQVNIASLATGAIPLGPVYKVTPKSMSLETFMADPESYESQYIKISGVAPTATAGPWPAAGSDANIDIWDGFTQTILRIDRDTDIDDSTEVTYPVNIQGVVTQFDNSAPYNSGHQISPNFYTDFTQDVSTAPNKHFALVEPTDASEITLDDSAQVVTFAWDPAVDLDGDALIYQWVPIGSSPELPGNGGADTSIARTGEQLLAYFSASDTVELKWTVATKEDKTGGVTVYSVDTLTVTLIKGNIVSDVEGYAALPTEFNLDQNYPNPFNPTTTIRFALPKSAFVTLKIYNMLGQEVATLMEEQRPAGYVSLVWNGRDRTGASAATGVYIYRIIARPIDGSDAFVNQMKMVLVK